MSDAQSKRRSGVGGFVAAVLFVGLGGGFLYSSLRIRDLTYDLDELRRKLTHKPATRESVPAVTVLPSAAPAGGDLTSEVDRLRKEIDALKAVLGAQPAPTSAQDGTTTPAFTLATPPGETLSAPLVVALETMSDDQKAAFKKSVLAVVDERERERMAKKQERRKNEIVEQLAQKLGLTDVQKERVQTTIDQAAARIAELRMQRNDQNVDQIRNDIRTTMKTVDDGIRLLLTAEQATLYDQWKAEVNPRQMFGVGGGGGGRGKIKGQQIPQR